MPWRWLLGRGWQHQVFQRDRLNMTKQTSCPVQNVFWKKPEIVASTMQHHHCIRPCSQDFANAVPARLWKWNGHKKYEPRWQGWWQLMFDASPISRKLKSQNLGDAEQELLWCLTNLHALGGPGGQRNASRWGGLSTAPAVFGLRDSPPFPRRGTEDRAAAVGIPTAKDVHPIRSFAPHGGVCVAGRRRRPAEGDYWPRRRLPTAWLETKFWSQVWRYSPRLEVPETQQNAVQKLSFQKKHWIKRCIACHTLHLTFGWWTLDFGWTKCIEMWGPILSSDISTSTHSNTLQVWPMKFQQNSWGKLQPRQIQPHLCLPTPI